jgi:hypothetical protein
MNSVDMATNLIFRAKNLQEFTVTTDLPDDFAFQGVVPFDMSIKDGQIEAKVWAVDFNEAVARLNEFLQNRQ